MLPYRAECSKRPDRVVADSNAVSKEETLGAAISVLLGRLIRLFAPVLHRVFGLLKLDFEIGSFRDSFTKRFAPFIG